MRAFVTGATGFLGKYVVNELLSNGVEVSALVRTINKMRELPKGVCPVAGDITRPDTMRAAMTGADAVFHLAAWYYIGAREKERRQMWEVNVEGTHSVLGLAVELGIPKIVYTSSVAVYGHTGGQLVDESFVAPAAQFASEYERTKHAAHYQVAVPLQQRGAPIMIVCPGQIYGEGDNSQMLTMVRLYLRGMMPMMLGSKSRLTWVHAADAARGHWLAYQKGKPGETYILAGPALSFKEFFNVCEEISGKRAPLIWLPGSWAGGLAKLLAPLRLGGMLSAEIFRSMADISYLATPAKANRDLGWSARSVRDGVGDYLKWAGALE